MRGKIIEVVPAALPDDDSAARWQEQRIKSAFLIMRRKIWLIVACSIAGLGGAAAYLANATPQYSATALVLLDTRSKYSNFDTVVASPREGDPIVIRTEVEVLRSRAIAERVVRALDLTNDPEFKPQHRRSFVDLVGDELPASVKRRLVLLGVLPDGSNEDEVALTTRRVEGGLSVDSDGRSYIVTIHYSASTGEKAAKIANAFAAQYLASQIDAKKAITASANEWAKSQVDAAGEQLREAESAIEQFRNKNKAIMELVPGPGSSVAATQQLTDLNRLLAAATEERITAETRLAAARKLVAAKDVYAIPQVVASPLRQQLRVDEARAMARKASLEARLGGQYPDLKAADSELARVRGTMREEVTKIVSSLASSAELSRAREADLAGKVEALRKDVGEVSGLQFRLSNLEREATARREFYTALQKRYVETSALLQGVYADARIIAPASPEPLPSSPKLWTALVVGLLGGAAVGAAIAALVELSDKSFRTAAQLEEATGLTCLGILPDLGRALHRALAGDLSGREMRVFREAVRSICSAMDATLRTSRDTCRVVLVTSALPHEGKTVSSVALATVMAARGSKTLLVDADLHRSPAEGHLEVGSPPRDLAAILADGDGCRAATQVGENLYVIKGERGHDDAQQVFLSARFAAFIGTARAEFDAIVIDSPPATVVADAAVLAPFADVVLHVVRWGKTRRSAVLEAISRIRRSNREAVSLTMMNRVDLGKYRRYSRDGGWNFEYAKYYRSTITVSSKKQLS
jgi:capsular exopolysaccharide synthesis family protein